MIRNPTGQSIQKHLVEETILGLRSGDKLLHKKKKKKGYLLSAPWTPINGRINVGGVVIAISCGPVQVMGMNHSGTRRKGTKSEARQETEIEYKKHFWKVSDL